MQTILNSLYATLLCTVLVCSALTSPLFAQEPPVAPPANDDTWQSLFDGRTLEGWKPSDFTNPGETTVEAGTLRIAAGQPMSGVTYEGEFPTENYEIRLQAMLVEGHDFFCALTVPVGDSYCTLVLGGWGGNTTGISSIDGYDASENETSKFIDYSADTWYAVRLRVTEDRITAWIDPVAEEAAGEGEVAEEAAESEPVIDFPRANRNLSTRWEVNPSKPLGIATYSTTGALREIEYRSLPASP